MIRWSILPVCILICSVTAGPISEVADTANPVILPGAVSQDNDDLNAAASSTHARRYSDWSDYNSPGYGSSGYGYYDDKYNNYGGSYYDNSIGYGTNYPSYDYSSYGYGKGHSNGYGYGKSYSEGYGGYGGYGGNGGLSSYYGYNNPYYQGYNNHLGYGYYGKKLGHGNIYSNAVAPSLVTGYRGYTRR